MFKNRTILMFERNFSQLHFSNVYSLRVASISMENACAI